MPLESLPDRFDDATHDKLDQAVNESVEEDLADSKDLSIRDYAQLLHAIVMRDKDMDGKYVEMKEGKKLINTYGELRDMLTSAWKRKSYREIRNLAILRAPRSDPEQPASKSLTTISKADLHIGLSASFKAVYHGAAIDGFYEYLTYNEKLFKNSLNPRYYAKFCSVVQSSGTGKSRMLTELSKKGVVVIYMNLRGENEESGFPARDPIPSQILTEFPPTKEAYRTNCYAFFIALFETLEEYLSTVHATRKAKESIMDWVRQMCDMSHPPRSTARADFFRKVSERYPKVHADLDADSVDKTSGSSVDKTADELRRLSLSEPKDDLNVRRDTPTPRLLSTYKKMARSLEKILADIASVQEISGDSSDQPKLVIAVDEAHPLTSIHPKGNYNYRPADILCRVVNAYSHYENHAVWVVFASTTSKVSDFSPPNQKHNSDRVAIRGEKLFPPYTQLGWDQSALGIGDIDIEHVSRLGHIVGYGRPLWVSLKTALSVPESVLSTASSKLCGGHDFNARKMNHVLAVLGQRFGLNVTFGHPDSVEHLENGVASHLRICLATTLDRNWRFTSYPSEPLLSCVAAVDLHSNPENLEQALGTLLQAVNSGMIDVGQRGELASRLLWLLAKDFFIRTQVKKAVVPSTWDEDLIDCEMIPVVDWLEFIFGPRIWDEDDTEGSVSRKTFQNAYLNFSHWVCMEANIAGSKQGGELRLNEWTLRHWQRTSAVQCCHQQPLIDKVIPIYFKGGPEGASSESRMSQIFISDKARESKASKTALNKITRRDPHISSQDTTSAPDYKSLPYIAILADLGRPSSFSVTYPERGDRDRCLRIYAAGVDTTMYPFLAKHPALVKTLEDLVHLQQIPETEMAYMEYLNAQVKFGSTATPEHMHWEHGSMVPEMSRKSRASRRS